MTCGSSMLAMILSWPPQRAQPSISMPNRCCRRRTQLGATYLSVGGRAGAAAGEDRCRVAPRPRRVRGAVAPGGPQRVAHVARGGERQALTGHGRATPEMPSSAARRVDRRRGFGSMPAVTGRVEKRRRTRSLLSGGYGHGGRPGDGPARNRVWQRGSARAWCPGRWSGASAGPGRRNSGAWTQFHSRPDRASASCSRMASSSTARGNGSASRRAPSQGWADSTSMAADQ